LEDGSDDGADNDPTLEYPEATEHQEPTAVDETQALYGFENLDDVGLADPSGEPPHVPDDHLAVGSVQDTSEETHTSSDEVHDDLDNDSEDTVSKYDIAGPDELDSSFVAMPGREADLTDHVAETSTSEPQEHQEDYPELVDDPDWDDDLDGEGDIDGEWTADPDDEVSNQSSATLSSATSSSKRGYDEVDFDNEPDGDNPSPQNSSPDPKRPRVR